MFPPVPRRFSLSLALGFALIAFAAAQQPSTPAAPPHRHRHHHRAAAAGAQAAKVPKPASELAADLAAKLGRGVLAGDHVHAQVAGDTITLTGFVHRPENKGQATRLARKIAARDGWAQAHVLNQLQVE